jgi:Cd2+/Zn2+-exporting ATPase
MEEKNEKILQIILGAFTFIIAYLIDRLTNLSTLTMFFIYLIPYAIVAYDSFKEAFEEIKEGEFFDESVLMIIATMGAMLIGFMPNTKPMFSEGIFVMLFFQVGELFEIIAEGKSEKSIKSLMNIRPDYANIEIGENETSNKTTGKTKKISPDTIKIGDIIVVKPGEKVPLDGIVIEGKSSVNTLAITGESVPREINAGDNIYSGFVNKEGILKVKVTKTFGESTASKIIDLVKNASSKKSKSEKFISKFSRIYTPVVIIAAVLIAVIPSIITKEVAKWLIRGLTFLIVSCPCALVISVPLSFFGGIGGASKKGVLFKGSNYLEAIANMNTLVFDKTGTLTEGVFEVTAIHPKEINEKELLHIAAHVERHSNHPIAISLVSSYTHNYDIDDGCDVKDVKEVSGIGVKAKVNGETIYVGSSKLMDKINVPYEECNKVGTIIHVASDSQYYGHIIISDKIKEDSKEAIRYFKENRIRTIMLTGDKTEIAKSVANELELDEYYAELLPQDKVKKIEELVKANDKFNKRKNVGFVGDGINDAPSLARADIGIAMGGIGQDAAIEASDVVVMQDKLTSLIDAIKIAKKTLKIARENIIFSITIKILVLILSAFGLANMWMAVFADVGVTIIDVLNSMRTLK